MYVTLPYVGLVNADHIRSTAVHPAKWKSHGTRWWKVKNGRVRRVGAKPWKDKTGWHRPNNWWDGGRWYDSACLMVYYRGKDYPTEIAFTSTQRAVLAMEELDLALQALTERGVERIVAAAVIRLEDNRAWTPADGDHTRVWMTYTQPAPARHHHILHTMPGDALNVTQGFLTSTGRFVARKEARGIAVAAGQVKASTVSGPDLFSEDVW